MRNRLKGFFSTRSTLATPSADLLRVFDAGPTAAGVAVSPEKAMGHPTVFSCVTTLSEDVAKTPLQLRRKGADGAYTDAVDHPLYEILHDLANPEMTAHQFRRHMMTQALMYGVAYAEVQRVDDRIVALWPLQTQSMRVDRLANGTKRWIYQAGDRRFEWTFDASQPPILELTVDTPIVRCRELIGTALAVQEYVGRFFGNGARPAGALVTAERMSPEAKSNLRTQWSALFGSTRNAHKTAVLDGGIAYQPFASQNDHAQLTEVSQALRLDICGAFKMPPWKTGDLSKTSYANLEAGELAYLSGTLDPLFVLWESCIRRDLLTTRQFGQFDVQFDRASLIRSDIKSLHVALAQGIGAGFYSPNDARKILGLNPIDGGDTYMVNSALVPVVDVKGAA